MRRQNSPFNLSLLDLLTAALGAVIFLFIITPKGGVGAATTQQASIFFDTVTMQIHGVLPDSLIGKTSGDTLFAMLVDYRAQPTQQETDKLAAALAAERRRVAEAEEARRLAEADLESAEAKAKRAKAMAEAAAKQQPSSSPKPAPPVSKPPVSAPVATSTPAPAPAPAPKAPETKPDPAYRGTPPSVPALLSFELNWEDAGDNVDLFVCQGNNCVFGNRKRDSNIGTWDSGKSRNRIFGNDLRTNQEAVRQFDKLLPGTYTIYGMFKESEKGRKSVSVNGLIYTKDSKGKPRGETYTRMLTIGDTRTRLITVEIKADGTFTTR